MTDGFLLEAPVTKAVEPAVERSPIVKVLEYTPMGEREAWRVEKFEEFSAEFDLGAGSEEAMARFHELAQRNARGWMVCRKLFGIGPMILPADADPAEYEPKTRGQLAELLGIDGKQLQAELDAVRAGWNAENQRDGKTGEQGNGKGGGEQGNGGTLPREELDFGDDLLREHGFDEGMFQVKSVNPSTKQEEVRPQHLNKLERDWFIKRVRECMRMLSEPSAGALARTMLMNELYLRRCDEDMASLSLSSKKWQDLHALRQDLEKVYQKQVTELQEMFPETATAGKEGFLRVLSDLNKAYREYYGKKSRVLVDKFMTANEIEVMVRMSVQRPEPQYRWGLHMAMLEAQHHLFDPNYRPTFKQSTLAKLDAGFKAAVMAYREALNEPLVDLEKGVLPGEGDHFPDLVEEEDERQ